MLNKIIAFSLRNRMVVVVGGLLSSTLLDQIVTPALFYKFGRKIYEHRFDAKTGEVAGKEVDELGLPVE